METGRSRLIVLTQRQLRGALWGLLVVLSGALVFYPKHFALEYAPVQSLRVFPNLPLFGGTCYVWFSTLVALTFLPGRLRGTPGVFEGLALAGVFSLTYRGMWDILLPDYSPDGLSNIITAQFIMDGGTIIATNANIAYLDFPGLHVVTVFVARIIDSDVKFAVVVMLLVLDVLTAALLYLIALVLLKDVRLGVFAAVLSMLGNPVFAYYSFYPAYLGTTLLFAFLIPLFKDQTSSLARGCVLVLLAGATVSHFISSLAFAFAIAGVIMVDLYLRQRHRLAMATFILFAAVPVVWTVYGTSSLTFRNLTVILSESVRHLAENKLFWFATVARANLGGNQPLWARGVKFFWLFTLYGLGAVTTLSYVVRSRLRETATRVATGAFCGLTLLSITATVVSVGGDQFFRFLVFAPVFTAPLLIGSLHQSPAGRAALRALVLAIIALSVPTLLAYRSPVEMYTYYPQEYYVGRFISSAAAGEDPEIYSLALSRLPILRYETDGHYFDEGQGNVDLVDENGLWKAVSALEQRIRTAPTRGRLGLFIHSGRPKVFYQHIFGIMPASREWASLDRWLSEGDLTYDSHHARVYMWRP